MQAKWQDLLKEMEGIDVASPKMFLLRKRGGEQLDSFRLRPLGDETRLHDKLRRKLITTLEEMAGERRPLRRFDRDYDGGSASIMDIGGSMYIKNTVESILLHSDSDSIGSLKRMKDARYSAALFTMPGGDSIVALDTAEVYHEAFDRVGHLLAYDDGGSDLEGMILFKFSLPCIYFEKLGRLLVLDRRKTESMFNLLEHYQENIRRCFAGLASEGKIDVDQGALHEWTGTNKVARRVNAMIQNGHFDQGVDHYEKYEKYLEEHPDIDDEGLRLRIEGGRIVISDKEHFESFLNFAERNLQQSVIDPEDVYLATKKRKVGRTSARSA